MANYEVPENPEYSEAIRQIEVSDLIHADVVNPIFRQLVHNDAFLKKNMPAVGTCNTAKGTAEKTVDCPDFAPYDGARIMVTFTQGSSTNYMTLNVNGTGGAAVWFPVGETRTYNSEAIAKFIAAGCAYEFIYQQGETPEQSKWVYCGIVSTADTLGAVKKTGDTMTGDLVAHGMNGYRFLRCGNQYDIPSLFNYTYDWAYRTIFDADWNSPLSPDSQTAFGISAPNWAMCVTGAGKIYVTSANSDGTYSWVPASLSKAEIEAGYLSNKGGRVTGNITMPAVGTMICGQTASDTEHNHALLIGHEQQDYWNFYEYGGVFNFYRSRDGSDTLLGRITENGWEGDATRAYGLQSFRANGNPYNRGEYIIKSTYGNDEKFWLQCINNNSNATQYGVAVDFANGSWSANASQYLRTFSASGDGHGDDHLLQCRYNLLNDGCFCFRVGNGTFAVETDRARYAMYDWDGRNIADTYMPKSGGTFTRQVDFDVYGKKISVGPGIIASEDYTLDLGNYQGTLVRLVIQTDTSSGNEAHLSVHPDYRDADTRYSDCYLGTSDKKWDGLYAKNGTILTSDKNYKTDIRNLDTDLTIKFIKGLIPSSYKMVDGQSGRTHYGLIAQDIEVLMGELGMSSTDFAGFIKSPKTRETWENENGEKLDKPIKEVIEGEFDYALRYDEFIAPIVTFVQHLDAGISNFKKEVESLQEENTGLKKRLEALEKIILKTGGADGT